jgi:hypothetical protein
LLDSSGTITAQVSKDSEYTLGHTIDVKIRVSRCYAPVVQKLDDFCAKNGVRSYVSETNGQFKFVVKSPRDVHRMLELIEPYFMERAEVANILMESLIPELQRGDYLSDKETFLELVEMIDYIKELNPQGREQQYNEGYFREEWNL